MSGDATESVQVFLTYMLMIGEKVVHHLTVTCNLDYGFLKYSLPADTIDVRNLKRIHLYKKDFKTQISNCSQWGSKERPCPDFEMQMKVCPHRRKQTNRKCEGRPPQRKFPL